MRNLVLVSVFLFSVAGALAGRALTGNEKARLTEALTATGCSGGSMEFDDGKFEVEDAVCADGKTYELVFDKAFELIEKNVEDGSK